jgi:hypothetical protein
MTDSKPSALPASPAEITAKPLKERSPLELIIVILYAAELCGPVPDEMRATQAGFLLENLAKALAEEAESRASRAEARAADLEAFVRQHGKTILCSRVDAREGPSMPKLFTAAQKAMVPLVEWQEALARIAEMEKR